MFVGFYTMLAENAGLLKRYYGEFPNLFYLLTEPLVRVQNNVPLRFTDAVFGYFFETTLRITQFLLFCLMAES